MELTCYGAAGEVTGSCHHLRCGDHRLLLDCGLFQGTREEEARNARPLPFNPADIDAVVLSHAHLDHCGRLPLLVRGGFRGPIHTHAVSIDLVRILLRDAAWLEASDTERENRRRAQRGKPPLQPLFGQDDVDAVMRQMRPLPFGGRHEILPGITVTLGHAGHILGAASVLLDLRDGGMRRRLLYSGDIGPDATALIPDPSPPAAADVVLMESTYGDRDHRSREDTLEEIGRVLDAAWDDGGNLLVPSFAIGRTQEMLALFAQNFERWKLARWRIFLDSPMAIEATAVHDRHADQFHDGARKMIGTRRLHELLPNFHETPDTAQSIRLNAVRSGAIIIAGSGMCTGGRILHHLANNLPRQQTDVMIIGYQGQGTLGRRLVDGAERVRIHGNDVRVNARIHTIGGLSAHAGQSELARWYGAIDGRPPVHLVHGEARGREGLAARLQTDYGVDAGLPAYGDTIHL
ncbi:MBL fold metallo-hydrolase RNA specificity domain-containing protein [Luteimonas dalianensis]|uniref:MBL fold metallo-hydrolase RNA specificity domain-containing protein n=1 Tax=Luteimonas dalianensis TaxID=1148196 RepID=UPI003BF1B72D